MSDDDERPKPPTVRPRDPRRTTGRRADMTHPPPTAPVRSHERPREVHLRPVDDYEAEMIAIARREARAIVDDMLEGLEQRVQHAVDSRMSAWMQPVSERLDEIASQQGEDVKAQVARAAWEAERLATERAEVRIRAIEDAARAREAHYVSLSVQIAERKKTEAETEHLPKGARVERWKVYALVLGGIGALLTALGASTIISQCATPRRTAPTYTNDRDAGSR